MAVDSNRLLEDYLNAVPDLGPTVAACVEDDEATRALLTEVFTGSADTEGRITDLSQRLIEWAADLTDSRLTILVFCAAIDHMNTELAPSLAQTLLGIAKSHITPDTDPRLVALYHFADALIDRDGNAPNHFEIVHASALKLLDPELPLWREKFNAFALHLAYRGRLKEVEHFLPGLKGVGLAGIVERELATAEAILALFDCGETGRLEPFGHLVQVLGERDDVPAESEDLIAGYEVQALVMRQVLARQPLDLPPEAADDEQARLIGDLLAGDLKAIHQRIEYLDYAECLIPSTLFGYNGLRLALALRDHDLAADLLAQRREAGFDHYLDGLFLARIAMLRGEAGKAASHFADALRAAEFYAAHDRLEFELHLAGELSPIQTAWLGHRIDLSRPYEPPGNAFTQERRRHADLSTFQGHTLAVGEAGEDREHLTQHRDSDEPCLIVGPAGCGHHALASQLHRDSKRHKRACISLSCAAVADADLQPLLFGALTDEPGLLDQVAGGSLLFHHLEEASPRMQAGIEQLLIHGQYRDADGKLREMDAKVVCTACVNSPLDLRERLRPGLWARLQVLPIRLPPLAALREHFDELVSGILRDVSQRSHVQVTLEPSLLASFGTYEWPGNLDELRSLLAGLYLRNPQQNHFTMTELPAPWRELIKAPEDADG